MIYYYQQRANDTAAEPDFSVLNPTYNNRFSDEYNKAWNEARTLTAAGYTALTVCGTEHPGQDESAHGANGLSNPRLKVVLTEEQLQAALENGLSITVSYRRNATLYKVNHWVPESLCGLDADEIAALEPERRQRIGTVDYVLLHTVNEQGRVGGLSRVSARTDGIYALLTPQPFAQQLVTNDLVMDIYYVPASSYRIIFDTDYSYIRRQQVKLGEFVNFMEVNEPTRDGYTFGGWQYLKKDAVPENGEYKAEDYRQVPKIGNDYILELTPALLSEEALLTDTDGVPALHLYPKWDPAKTQVTVVFWTEDLDDPYHDVYAMAEGGGTAAAYNSAHSDYQDGVKTDFPIPNENNANYSNAGSFTFQWDSGELLVKEPVPEAGKRVLVDEIQEMVNTAFESAMMPDGSSQSDSVFYTQAMIQVLYETDRVASSTGETLPGTVPVDDVEVDYNTVSASPDGNTLIYVYYTRNIYTLKFHYFGEQGGRLNAICVNTNGFSWASSPTNFVQDGELIFGYSTSGIYAKKEKNQYELPFNREVADMPVPQTITIQAKYGADLRPIWPAAQASESVALDKGGSANVVSWATTAGQYNVESRTSLEPTIMGLYATMDRGIIADPGSPDVLQINPYRNDSTPAVGTPHFLVAYWYYNDKLSFYRFNHCFELPGLDVTGMETVSLYNDSTEQKDTLYLVPYDTKDIFKYGFTDLIRVSGYDETAHDVISDPNGQYYAVRSYTTQENGSDVTKYYALGRQVTAVSSNAIGKQNPSARAHMTRVNTVADHTSEYTDAEGQTWSGNGITNPQSVGTATDPYDLYFYYGRNLYTITYKVPTPRAPGRFEATLGTVTLPYGAIVTKEQYAFPLDYRDTNMAQFTDENGDTLYKYRWSFPKGADGQFLPAEAVCPSRNENGETPWKFKGWALGPKGSNMQWEMTDPETAEPQAQIADDFPISSDLLLYAIWETPILNVTFHLNGGVVSGKDDGIITPVPANMTLLANSSSIPRPFHKDYSFEGWYEADLDANGNIQRDQDGNVLATDTPFDFDQPIIQDEHVVAKWTRTVTNSYQYTVYYVTEALAASDTAVHDTLWINGATKEVLTAAPADPTGYTQYYLLGKTVRKNQVYTPGTQLTVRTAAQEGYVPDYTDQVFEVDSPNDTYNVIFTYHPGKSGSHTVQYVLAGTETASPAVKLTVNVSADQTVVTPDLASLDTLKNLGYELVNRTGSSGNYAYTPVKNAGDLTWLDPADASGTPKGLQILSGNIPGLICFLVQPVEYTVTYTNAPVSSSGLDAKAVQAALDSALSAVTSPSGTAPSKAAPGKNPTLYTVEDQDFAITNPTWVSLNGELYRFLYWSLGENTYPKAAVRLRGEGTGGTYNPLTVSQGSVGNLAFVANWAKAASGNLTVTTSVTGAGDKNHEFSYTVKLTDGTLPVSGTFGGKTFDGNGEISFTLKHGESWSVSGLPDGTAYTVAEGGNAGYTVSTETAVTPNATAVAATGSMASGALTADQTTSVRFINHMPEPTPTPTPTVPPTPGPTPSPVPSAQPGSGSQVSTGDDTQLGLYAMLFGLSAVGMTATLVTGKRRRKEEGSDAA